jgi:uncharacterized RDD family membrane protein YckC
MAVCKRCGCAIPLGQKTCDICEPRIATASAQTPVWQPPQPQQPQPQQPPTWQVAQPPTYQATPPQTYQTFGPPGYQAGQPQAYQAAQPQAYQAAQPQAFPGIMPASELASSAQAWAGRAGGMSLTAETAPKAGFWMRVLAWIIDGFCYGIPAYAVGHVILHGDTATYFAVNLIIEICYFMYFWSSYGKGQTIGMQLLHMKVVRTDGKLLSLSGAFIRFIGIILAALPLDLGLIWVAFDANKQGWHDKLAGTYVISNW